MMRNAHFAIKYHRLRKNSAALLIRVICYSVMHVITSEWCDAIVISALFLFDQQFTQHVANQYVTTALPETNTLQ